MVVAHEQQASEHAPGNDRPTDHIEQRNTVIMARGLQKRFDSTVVLRDLTLIGSVGYTTAVWSRVVDMLGAGLVDLAPVVARRFPAERFEDAFALMGERDGVVGRILLEHGAA